MISPDCKGKFSFKTCVPDAVFNTSAEGVKETFPQSVGGGPNAPSELNKLPPLKTSGNNPHRISPPDYGSRFQPTRINPCCCLHLFVRDTILCLILTGIDIHPELVGGHVPDSGGQLFLHVQQSEGYIRVFRP